MNKTGYGFLRLPQKADKTIDEAAVCRQVDLFLELGGMPSSHSSTVCALATSVGIIKGCSSVDFAISCIFAMIVMTDASGVRRAVGDQAIKINEILEELIYNNDLNKTIEKINEILGHTPVQVLMGMLLGIAVAFAIVR